MSSESRPPSLFRVARAWFFCATFAVLLALNLPLYAGLSFDGFRFRMEHGRLLFERSDAVRGKSPYVAPNSEGLRWQPEWRFDSPSHWRVNVPLWIPLGITMAEAWWLTRKRRAARDRTAAPVSA